MINPKGGSLKEVFPDVDGVSRLLTCSQVDLEDTEDVRKANGVTPLEKAAIQELCSLR